MPKAHKDVLYQLKYITKKQNIINLLPLAATGERRQRTKEIMNVNEKFTMEEIFFIKLCRSNQLEEAIRELKVWVHYVAPDISEAIHSTISKLSFLCDEEYMELRNP